MSGSSTGRNRRPRRYGEQPQISQHRHYVQVMVYGDCHQRLQELMERHNLSASGAAHHLAWSVELLLPLAEPTSRTFLETLERQFIEAHGSKKRRSDKGEPWKPDKERPDELMVVKFKAQQLSRRDGSVAPGPRLIDARKQPWNGAAIGNGSRLVIAYVIHAWDRPEGVGITLIPRAAQVLHYVPYQESDPTQGFQEQEGYSQEDAAPHPSCRPSAAPAGRPPPP